MIKKFKHQDLIWIDLQAPTDKEIDSVLPTFQIHPSLGGELSAAHAGQKLDVFNNYLHLVLQLENQINHFLLGPKVIITAHHRPLEAVINFGSLFESGITLKRYKNFDHAGYVLIHLLKESYRALAKNLDDLNEKIRILGSGGEKNFGRALPEIFSLNQNLWSEHRILNEQGPILKNLLVAGRELYGEEFLPYLKTIVLEQRQNLLLTTDNLMALRNLMTIIQLTFIHRQNQFVKHLLVGVLVCTAAIALILLSPI